MRTPSLARGTRRLRRPVTDDRDAVTRVPASSCAAPTTRTSTSHPTSSSAKIDDISLARRFKELGLAGFLLKSHYTSTAERAQRGQRGRARRRRCWARSCSTARSAGINPLAVEIAAREGARTVWMPTVDSVNEAARARGAPGRARCRSGSSCRSSCASRGRARARGGGRRRRRGCCPRPARSSSMIARHGMVLATGHLARDEIFAVVDAASCTGCPTRSWSPTPSSRRRACRSTIRRELARARRAARALLHDPVHRQGRHGSTGSTNIRADRCREHRPVHRSRPGIQSAGRGWYGADGGPAPRGRLQRGGGPHDGRRQHAPGRGATTP